MKFSVSGPVVQVAVEPKSSIDFVKLVKGMRSLSQADPVVQVLISSPILFQSL